MKFIGKQLKEKGIVLIALIIIVVIIVAIVSFVIKSVFDAKSMGANRK